MGRAHCINCGSELHLTWSCPQKKSTAARKDVQRVEVSGVKDGAEVALSGSEAGTQALPVDTNREPSPSSDCKSDASPKEGLAATGSNPGAPTKFDKVAYQREYMRARRAKLKEGQANE